MRIIGGTYRGKKLFTPDTEKIRPTSDRAREALFNILNSRLEKGWASYNFLDVFAGTGAVALEAISRGAASACLVDKDTKLSTRNAALFPLEKSKIRLLGADAANLPAAASLYNLVFLDAPYNQGLTSRALASLANKNWLAADALIIAETEKNEQVEIPAGLEVIEERLYGLAKFIFLQLKDC